MTAFAIVPAAQRHHCRRNWAHKNAYKWLGKPPKNGAVGCMSQRVITYSLWPDWLHHLPAYASPYSWQRKKLDENGPPANPWVRENCVNPCVPERRLANLVAGHHERHDLWVKSLFSQPTLRFARR